MNNVSILNISIHMFTVFHRALFTGFHCHLSWLSQVGLDVEIEKQDGDNGGETLDIGDKDPGVVTLHPEELRVVEGHDEKLGLKQKQNSPTVSRSHIRIICP